MYKVYKRVAYIYICVMCVSVSVCVRETEIDLIATAKI